MRSLLLIPCLLLAACGGGSGSGSTTTTPIHHTRAIPGGTVEVTSVGSSSFTVSTSLAEVRSAEVLIGTDYDNAQALTVSASGAGAWIGSAAPGANVLVRLTLVDGSVIETAPGDFPLR